MVGGGGGWSTKDRGASGWGEGARAEVITAWSTGPRGQLPLRPFQGVWKVKAIFKTVLRCWLFHCGDISTDVAEAGEGPAWIRAEAPNEDHGAVKQVPASLKDVLHLPVEAVQFMKSQPGVCVSFMSVMKWEIHMEHFCWKVKYVGFLREKV